jgi:predicted GH43/DUF377 family glycosyl hydrolase
MRKIVLLVFVFDIVLLNSCSNSELTDPSTSTEQLSIRLEKASIPSEVAWISSQLTRTGFQSKSSKVEVNGSSAVVIEFSELAAGSWHLKIDALNDSSVAIYSGETDVEINSDKTTQVSLKLSPTGKLVVNVDWQKGVVVTDYTNNPILSHSLDTLSNPTLGIYGCFVLNVDGKYKMWYSGNYGNSKYDIHYAESSDGISWQSITNRPIMSPGYFGNYDAQGIHAGPVLYENGIYKMYFVAAPTSSGATYIGYATSYDGITWTNAQIPIISAENTRFAPNGIIKKDNKYYLYYSYTNVSTGKQGVAVSQSLDGINWTIYSSDVLLPEDSWEYPAIHFPTIQLVNNKYIMIYGSTSNSGFGIATSSDGLTWVKESNNPIFEPASTTNYWTTELRYPCLIQVGNDYRLYYTGYKDGLLQVGFATVTL